MSTKSRKDEIEIMVKNSIELCKMHDYFRRGHSPEVITTTRTNFDRRVTYYTILLSIYASVNLVYEYCKDEGLSFNSGTFVPSDWGIHEAYQADDSGNRDTSSIDLDTVVRRFRNSIAHMRYKVIITKPQGEVFEDVKPSAKATDTTKRFYLEFRHPNLEKFLTKFDAHAKSIMNP